MTTKTILLLGAALWSVGHIVHAAASDECPDLAQSFHDSVFVMDAASLGRLRACAKAEAWPVTKPASGAGAAPPASASPFKYSLAAQVDKSCGPLAETVSRDGTKGLAPSARAKYLSCVDKAITYVSSQRKPPAIANQPIPGRGPGGKV